MEEMLAATFRGLAQGSLYTLLGLGFIVVYKATGVVNFAQPALMMFGAYFTSLFVVSQGLPFPVAILGAALLAGALGAATERVALRSLVGESMFSATMVTVGAFIALQIVVNRMIGVQPRTVGDPWGLAVVELAGVRLFVVDAAKFAVAVVVVAALLAFFRWSRTGLAMRATAADQETAQLQGISVAGVFSLSWFLAGVLAAVAGVFVGAGGAGIDTGTAFVALKALPAIVLGGFDSIGGAILGGAIIGLAEAYTGAYQPDIAPWLGHNFDQVVPYAVMLLVLLVRPYGLLGTREVERV